VKESLHGGSYSIKHCLKPTRMEKKHTSDLTPYPAELIPFELIDGSDTRYGQLYYPIGANPIKEAGLKEFKPPVPFQVSQNFLDVGNFKDFWWPTLSELNNELDPYPWRDENERRELMTDNPLFLPPVMHHGPPPLPPTTQADAESAPSITILPPQIIASTDKLFFIAHKIGATNFHEWCLLRVAFHDSILLYPSALQDGRFLVKFYVLHPSDVRYNTIDQRYWLQYSKRDGISDGQVDAHLITPSDTLEDRAKHHNLVPSVIGSTSPTLIPISTGHSALPRSVVVRVETILTSNVGTRWPRSAPCSLTSFYVLTSPRIPSIWTVAFTL
jgi:hypothetical protein